MWRNDHDIVKLGFKMDETANKEINILKVTVDEAD